MNYNKFRQVVRQQIGVKTAKEIAPTIGLSESTLSRFLSGGTVTLETYERLCDWLGCSMDEFRDTPVTNFDSRMRQLAVNLEQYVGAERPIDAVIQAILEEFGEQGDD